MKKIKKFLMCLFVTSLLVFSLTACGGMENIETRRVSPSYNGAIDSVFDLGAGVTLKRIDSMMFYDTNTKIVYFWNGAYSTSTSAMAPTPYISSTGGYCIYEDGEIVPLE